MRSPRILEYLRYGDSTGGHDDSCKPLTSILPPKLRNAARPAREHPVKPTSPAQPLITPSSLILPHTHTDPNFKKNSFGRDFEKCTATWPRHTTALSSSLHASRRPCDFPITVEVKFAGGPDTYPGLPARRLGPRSRSPQQKRVQRAQVRCGAAGRSFGTPRQRRDCRSLAGVAGEPSEQGSLGFGGFGFRFPQGEANRATPHKLCRTLHGTFLEPRENTTSTRRAGGCLNAQRPVPKKTASNTLNPEPEPEYLHHTLLKPSTKLSPPRNRLHPLLAVQRGDRITAATRHNGGFRVHNEVLDFCWGSGFGGKQTLIFL